MDPRIITVTDSLWRRSDPAWYVEGDAVAHLMADQKQSLCGYTIKPTLASQFQRRCASCTRHIAEFHTKAAKPIPELVQERLTLVVTRPTAGEPVKDVLERKLRSMKSWELSITVEGITDGDVDV